MKRKKTGIWMRAVIVCCLAVLSLGGCGKKTDQTVSDADVQQAGEDSGKETGKANKSLTDQGSAYLEQGEFDEAISCFEQAAAEKENTEESYRGIGIAKMGREDYEGALEAFDQALKEAGAEAGTLEYDICYYKASCMVRLGRLNDALELYNNLAAYKPELKTYVGRGAVYAKMGNMDMAREDFDRVISKDSKNYEQYIEIFRILDSEGRKDIGQEYLKQALTIDKDKDKNNLEKGKIYYYLEQYDKARSELEKIKGTDAQVTLYLAKTYEKLGDAAYAQTLYREYLEDDSSDGNIYNMIAISQMNAGDYQEALSTLQEGIEKAEYGKQNLFRNEIAVYEYLLDFDTALEKMEVYLASWPEDEEAAREYIFLQSRSK